MAAEPVDRFADDDTDDVRVVASDVVGDGSARRVLRPFVTDALAASPGPVLLADLTDLMGRDDLSAREWVEIAAGWRRVVAFGHAGLLTAVGEVDRALCPDPAAVAQPGRADPVRPAADELAPVLGIAPGAASALVGLARRVDDRLPAAADALAEGRMDLSQLRALDRVVRDLPATATRQVEAVAVGLAPRRTAQQLRHDLEHEAARVDPEHATRAAERGVTERDVSLRPSPLPGCRRMVADLPLAEATAAWLGLNGAAKSAKKAGVRPDGTIEDRSLAQLRADTMTALLTGQPDPAGGSVPTPDQLAQLAEVQVVVAADTLTGVSDLPAHVPGIGPLDVGTVRELAIRARWRRLVCDPDTGTLLHVDGTVHPPPDHHTLDQGAADQIAADPRWERLLTDAVPQVRPDDSTEGRYRPSDRLRRHVHTRDATCLGPACHHPAASTQLDHTVNHGARDEDGTLGTTTAGNLGSLCERIHNAKTHGDWHLRQPTPGTFIWTSPTGRTYVVRARPLIPGWAHRRQRPPPRHIE